MFWIGAAPACPGINARFSRPAGRDRGSSRPAHPSRSRHRRAPARDRRHRPRCGPNRTAGEQAAREVRGEEHVAAFAEHHQRQIRNAGRASRAGSAVASLKVARHRRNRIDTERVAVAQRHVRGHRVGGCHRFVQRLRNDCSSASAADFVFLQEWAGDGMPHHRGPPCRQSAGTDQGPGVPSSGTIVLRKIAKAGSKVQSATVTVRPAAKGAATT